YYGGMDGSHDLSLSSRQAGDHFAREDNQRAMQMAIHALHDRRDPVRRGTESIGNLCYHRVL
ncbi:MAG: hypothetical protein ACREJU_15910, partial [Nitrospiraceae bacterium]